MARSDSGSAGDLAISIVVPAFNEERYLGPTLDSLRRSAARLGIAGSGGVEILVIDHGSTDRTAEIAHRRDARVIAEPRGTVAQARNAGARAAGGRLLVFVDADTLWPEELLGRIVDAMADRRCLGGAVATDYRPRRASVRAYLGLWRIVGRILRMAQGATQFCRTDVFFAALGGYDESLFMGEDVDFFRRLRRAARRSGGRTELIQEPRVVPSCRRFDAWPLWRTVLLTNPLVALLFARSKAPWRAWYEDPTR